MSPACARARRTCPLVPTATGGLLSSRRPNSLRIPICTQFRPVLATPHPCPRIMDDARRGPGERLPSPLACKWGRGVALTPASPPLSHFRGEGSWGARVRCGWLCKLLGRRRLPLSPSLRRGRGGRGVRGSELGVALTPWPAGSPHPGFATPLPLTGRGVVGGVCEVWLVV